MARVTSSRERSKRKTKKPVTTSKGRQNRSSVSNARVTSASNGKTSETGSARVTQGQGGSRGSGSIPSTRQPRAITNGSSNTMRVTRAKAVQARRQAQGKSTMGGASRGPVKMPNSQRAGVNLPRTGAQVERQTTVGKSNPAAEARARQQGQRNVAQAQTKRGAKAAATGMSNKLAAARTARNIAGTARTGALAAVAAEGLTSRNTAKGTLKGKPTGPAQGPSVPKRLTSAGIDKMKFDDAFRQARKSGQKTFTWRGKKYTTETK